MSTSIKPKSKAKVEDMVKVAIKEAMEKRKISTTTDATTEETTVIEEVATVTSSTSTKKPLLANQKYFSDVIDNHDIENNFPVTVFDDYKWHDTIASFIPEVDTTYVIDKNHSRDILLAWELNEKVLCYGPTGAGKSSLIEQLCARTKRPFIRVNCTGDMDSSMIFGQLIAKDGSTLWVDGAVTEAVRHGAVFAWDEWDVTPPEISMGLQWLLEDNGKLFLKEMPGSSKSKMIEPHKHFRLVALGNTQGQGDNTGAHAGTNVQNSATLDRFGTAVFMDYLPSDIEEQMIMNKFDAVSGKEAKQLVKMSNLIRQGYSTGELSLTISPRSIFNICNKLIAGRTHKESFTSVYFNKLNDTQRKVAEELFNKVYGK